MKDMYSEFGTMIKAISDPTRLKIIDLLSCGELCACNILESVAISQSTLSYHMNLLTESGLIIGVKEGSWMHYSINREKANLLVSYLNHLFNEKEECICNSKNTIQKIDVCNVQERIKGDK